MPALKFGNPSRPSILFLLVFLAVWGGLVVPTGVLMPYQPRLRYVAPEGARIQYAEPEEVRTQYAGREFQGIIVDFGDREQLLDLESCSLSATSFSKKNKLGQIGFSLNNQSFSIPHDTGDQIGFSPNFKFMALNNNKELWLVEISTGRFSRHSIAGEFAFQFSPDSSLVAFTSSKDMKTIMVWNTIEDRLQVVLPLEQPAALEFSQDSRLLLTCYQTLDRDLWDLITGRQVFHGKRNTDSLIYSYSLSPDGRMLACWNNVPGSIELLDIESGKVLLRLPDNYSLSQFSQDSRSLATVTAEGIKVWKISTGREKNSIPLVKEEFKFLDAAGALLSLKDRGGATFWDLTVNPARKIFTVPEEHPLLSPDGFLIASTGERDAQSCMIVTDLRTLEKRLSLSLQYLEVDKSKFSPDSTLLAVQKHRPAKDRPFQALCSSLRLGRQGDDYTVELWDVTTGRRHALLPGCKLGGFWEDGKTLVTIDEDDKAVEVWDVPLVRPWGRILGLGFLMTCLVFGFSRLCAKIWGRGIEAIPK